MTDVLDDLMRADTLRPSSPDLATIHRLGRRRRTRGRVAVAGTVLGTVAVIGSVFLLLGPVGFHLRTTPAASEPHQVTSISAYEQRVLDAVPSAYAVDGTVVVPDRTPQAGAGMNESMPANRIVGEPRPLGVHDYAGGASPDPDGLPTFVQGNPPKDSQVVFDQGAAYLGCTIWPQGHTEADACLPSVLVKDSAGQWTYAYGLGKDEFLQDGAEMELFTSDDYSDKTWHAALIGGLGGTDTTRVVVRLQGGGEVEATVSHDVRHDATLFWSRMPAEARQITAYDQDGKVVAEHEVRSCKNPVDCEVR